LGVKKLMTAAAALLLSVTFLPTATAAPTTHRVGQVGAYDDAPADCTDKRLSETGQRSIATTYVSAFFRRYLQDDRSFMPVLTGAVRPGKVDVRVDQGS
jgi:hypothetical protein